MTPYLTRRQVDAKVAKLKAEPKPNPNRPEWEFVDDPSNSRNAQRAHFLKVAARLVPAFAPSLAALRPVDQFGQRTAPPDDATLMDWAKRWHLDGGAPWIIQWARMALHQEGAPVVRVMLHDVTYKTATGERVTPHDVLDETGEQVTHIRAVFDPPQPQPRTYRPDWESRQQYESYILDYIRHHMDEVVVQMRAHAETHGRGIQRPLLRREAKPFKWLVRFQILGERVADIAQTEKPVVTSDAVSAAVRSLARDIELKKLRKDPPGPRPAPA